VVVSKKVAQNLAAIKTLSHALVKLTGRLQAVPVTANIILLFVMAQQREQPPVGQLVELRLVQQLVEPLAAQP
jgi:hypothetical protein